MKVFLIPSWYPSASNPIYGTFVEEQVSLMAVESKKLTIGVSLWGQGDEPYLLYASNPLRSFRKLFEQHSPYVRVEENKSIFFSPAYTWTKRFRKGNLEGIIRANEQNLTSFIARHGKPDIIHAQASDPAAWISSRLSEKYNIPYLVTLRMSPFPFKEYLVKGQLSEGISSVLNQAKMLIATSRWQAKQAESFDLKKISVVHNPVDLNAFKPLAGKGPNLPFKLLAVGRLETQKGFDVLIEAMSDLSQEVTLDILGDGSDRKFLEKMIADRRLNERIRLVGLCSRNQVASFMQKADGYVLSSRHETFGNVLVEAMASGVPSVATKCGGPEELISDKTGILCEVNDPAGLAKAITKMMGNKWDADLIRSEAAARFSPRAFTERMLNVYEQVLDS